MRRISSIRYFHDYPAFGRIGVSTVLCCWLVLAAAGAYARADAPRFFPVLTESNLHWFSYFDQAYPIQEKLARHPAMAEEEDLPAISGRIADYQEALDDLVATGNNFAVAQGEILDALAQLYQQDGQWEKALAAKQQRYFLARIHNGLHDPGHVWILAELADLAQAAGDMAQADDYQHALLNLQTRILDQDDPALINTYLRWADWHLQNFIMTSSPAFSFNEWNAGPLMNPHFMESDSFYRKALAGMRSPGQLEPEGRLAMLVAMRNWQMLHFTAFENAGPDSAFAQHDPFNSGALSRTGFMPTKIQLLRVAEEMEPDMDASVLQDEEIARHTAAHLVMLGDWMNSIGLSRDGQARYQEADALLDAAGISEAWQQTLLAPGLPVPDPDDWYHFFSQEPVFSGHFDVALTLDSHGKVRDMVFAENAEGQQRMKKRLLRHIHTLRFRPFPAGAGNNGQMDQTLNLRFYYE